MFVKVCGITRPPITVDVLLEHATTALQQHGLVNVTVRGVLTGWRRTRTWGHGNRIAPGREGGDIVARLPVGVPGRAAADIEARLDRTHPGALAANPAVVVEGGLEIHPRFGPLRLVARSILVDDAETRRACDARTRTLGMLRGLGVFERQRAGAGAWPAPVFGEVQGADPRGVRAADQHLRCSTGGGTRPPLPHLQLDMRLTESRFELLVLSL